MASPNDVAAFIDGSNLYYGLKNTCGKTNLDFGKFVKKLIGSRRLIRAYYYNAPLDQNSDLDRYRRQQKFLNSISNIHYFECRLGKLVKRPITTRCPTCNKEISRTASLQKGVGVRLAVDMVSMARKGMYETALLVSGDADFTSAIQEVKDMGLHVELAYFLRDPQGRTGLSD